MESFMALFQALCKPSYQIQRQSRQVAAAIKPLNFPVAARANQGRFVGAANQLEQSVSHAPPAAVQCID